MSNQALAILITLGLLGVVIVACIVQHEERKARRGLPDPQPDTRNWQNIFMKDVK